MYIFSIKTGYIVTDGVSFVQTFFFRGYESRLACFIAAVDAVSNKETICGHHNKRLHHGKILRKAGTVYGRQQQRVYV